MHRFVYIEVLQLTGNDVIAIFQLESAADNFWLQILKERTQFHVCVLVTLFVHLQPFKSYSTFSFWL